MPPRFPFPLPNGWFAVAWSDELPAGQVRRLFYLDRELVAFRSTAGEARVFDAYCPHLGAHLGVGGTVVGDTLKCPFHGWRFDAHGRYLLPESAEMDARIRARCDGVLARKDPELHF